MKLKNLMSTNATRNNKPKIKHTKFADLGVSLLNNKRKRSYFNSSKHQNSEYIEINDKISAIQNKGK